MGGTDCAQPMIYAKKKRLEVDVFIVYTDCETWAGTVYHSQTLYIPPLLTLLLRDARMNVHLFAGKPILRITGHKK